MPLLRLFEFEDFAWFPRPWRDGITDFLSFTVRVGKLYDPVIPVLSRALQQIGEDQVLDCCSGAGGPWRYLYPVLRMKNPAIKLTLSDYFPNEKARQSWQYEAGGQVDYLAESVDAKNIPADRQEFRTFFTSFHHFDPSSAEAVLKDAVLKGTGIGIFESTKRNALAFLWMLILPLVIWVVTPLIRPFSWSRLFWTYLIPVIPVACAWDGLVSCWRTYSREELHALTAALGSGYTWEVGEITGERSPVPITYLIGLPRQRIRGFQA